MTRQESERAERTWNWFWCVLSLGHVGVGALLNLWALAAIGGFLAGAFFTRATGFGVPQ